MHSSVEITFLVWFCFCEATILWGRRLDGIKLRLVTFGTIKVAMFDSHFSANPSLFSILGKSLLKRSLAEGEKEMKDDNTIKCPGCGSTKNWKDGKRHVPSGTIQRYICRECALRFSVQLASQTFHFFFVAYRRFPS